MSHHASHDHHSTEIDPHDLGHIQPASVYVTVLAILLVLTVVTVWIAGFDFGAWNLVVAMLVASVKATLVAMFFMHLKYENPIVWFYGLVPFLFLLVLIGGLFIDNPYRVKATPSFGTVIGEPETIIPKDGH